MASGFDYGRLGDAWSANCDQSVIMSTCLADSPGGVTAQSVSEYISGYLDKSSGVDTAVCEQLVAVQCEPVEAVSPVSLDTVSP